MRGGESQCFLALAQNHFPRKACFESLYFPSIQQQNSAVVSTMKKYQLWLERKSYSQHLFNLMKIKYANHSPERQLRTTTPAKPHNDSSILTKYKQMEDFQGEAEKLGDISYAITFKELKNRKLRLMKSFQILNQNMSMARRIKEVKSVFNSSKEKANHTEYHQRKAFEKKIEHSNQELREQNFRRFMKWQSDKTNHHVHKYILHVQVHHISKLLTTHDEFAALWCEISTDRGFIKSELVEMDKFEGHKFSFSLESAFDEDIIFRLYTCKGLKSALVGQIQFRRPELGKTVQDQYKSIDKQLQMTLKISYKNIRRERTLLTLK